MNIISHRGYWKTSHEKNSTVAFRRSFKLGFGTETDVRDLDGALVISHDMPKRGAMGMSEFLALTGGKLPLALNIKSDGLAEPLHDAMAAYDRSAWFVFDMSIPDMRMHLKAGNPVFTRISEVEQEPVWLDECEGVWLDHFDREWFDIDFVTSLLDTGKRVCVVSSELHRRDYSSLWKMLLPLAACENVMVCTEEPEKAQDFFKGAFK
jgi:glycerophosphoryl diester phosphodiesterase